MNTLSRRNFLAGSAAALAGTLSTKLLAAEAPQFKLGMISYNVAQDWDLPTILKVCRDVGIAAVEARTTHKHGIEIARSAAERAEIKKQFADSGVVFWGCGSACEFHSADPAVVAKNIEETKQFVNRRQLTQYRLSQAGSDAYVKYRADWINLTSGSVGRV